MNKKWWKMLPLSVVWLGVLFLAVPSTVASQSSSSSFAAAAVGGGDRDPLVQSAPLIAGVVCADGVALLAVHTAFGEEPLLLLESEEDDSSQNEDDSASEETQGVAWKDIPRSYRGPFRIHTVDSQVSSSSVLMTAGWRPHGQYWTQVCRQVAQDEHEQVASDRNNSPLAAQEYGSYLARTASFILANRAKGGSGSNRPLRCAGLLAAASTFAANDDDDDADKTESASLGGNLWLVDATGAYPVRAYAVGSAGNEPLLSQKLLEYLDTLVREDSPLLQSSEEMLVAILEWLGEQDGMSNEDSGHRVELAILPSKASKPSDKNSLIRLQRPLVSKLVQGS